MPSTNSKPDIIRLIEASEEIEITRNHGHYRRYGAWRGFTWLSGEVFGNDPDDVLHEMLLEADRNSWKRLPIIQIDHFKKYLSRRWKRRGGKTDAE